MITISRIYPGCRTNDRAQAVWFTCEKTEECPLYQKGRCACSDMVFGEFTCPNAQRHFDKGPTRRASSFDLWVADKRAQLKTEIKSEDKKLSKVSGYYFLPMPFLCGVRNKLEGVESKFFVRDELFDGDYVEKVVKFRPVTWFGEAIIKDHAEKHVPKFIQQLKEEFPKIYNEWKLKYPESASEIKEFSPVGRIIYIKSLPDGCVLQEKYGGTFVKEGDILISEAWKSAFLPFGADVARVEIKIEDDMVTTVCEGMDIGNEPVFLD